MSDARQVSGRRSRALSHHASANDLWGGNAHEFFGADRIEIPDDASYDPTDAITVEVWVKADAWASRATNLRKNSSFILYNYSGGYSWYTYGPNHWQQYDIAGELGTGACGHIVGTYEKERAPTTSSCGSTARSRSARR